MGKGIEAFNFGIKYFEGKGPKVDAAEFIMEHGLKVGDRFGIKARKA